MKHSGLQKDVLSLYRRLLRTASVSGTHEHVSEEFRKQASRLRRNEFQKIEYGLRKGEKQLKLLKMSGVSHVVASNKW